MSKIGRNDPCPCMSGKKYKSCCMDKNYIEELEKQNLKYYDENYILSKIKRESQCFNIFYENERQKIKRGLFWLKKIINSGANMSYGTLPFVEGEPYCLAVKDVPILLKEDFQAAREIKRIISFEEGFKIVKFKEEAAGNYRKVPVKAINDMIYDPMIDSHLIKYGFDLNKYYKREDEDHKESIVIQPIESLRPHQVVFITTLYVKKTLQYRNIYPDISDEEIEFNKWIKENFEGLVPFSKTILKFVEEVGCSTTEKVESIFHNMIKSLKLEEALTVDCI
ncbi:SEC-C motif domain-containing protein [Clostridium pasteurianum DSM 525 = ATCC 6013]|uniref:SEC-C motif domain protein n=1 Tax=Clostridium pasteurianum DSM 525 = ATCC 6013 TaxID=1262449 RepID=A0A0H3J6V1_CLOPA|nr:SEC-C metal-binding domain-containing protein [Clostridium pasteurianum]AJA46705.1 SEC-C motif domain-containing protein [Clostridium pasteurianum DSM 525 = ATCC 6013]AJA50693.1 SEC-C motif domain-containing protein [Clostridium pasteurianum DSM 525 = ATCC 6013]AOZ74109.1 nucleic acid-binding protein [Clostridium pasteurianum DSM 525 = ATCC 6013]AOZ77906.1 nucleic acid-binding protein [Clostridium pasteurianum]ELP61272.1 SEC-C motif domain-containing protein [Clostridium pasteurianum DSM 52